MKISKKNCGLAVMLVCALATVQGAAAAGNDAVDVHRLLEHAVGARVTMHKPYASPAASASDAGRDTNACTVASRDPAAVHELARQLEADAVQPSHAQKLNFAVRSEVEFEFADRAPVTLQLGAKNTMTNRASGYLDQRQVLVDGALPRKIAGWALQNGGQAADKPASPRCRDLASWL